MAMFLSQDELVELTGRRRRDAQALALSRMGIEHRIRPDGCVVVLRARVEQLFGVTPPTTRTQEADAEPDWGALNEPAARRPRSKKPASQRP